MSRILPNAFQTPNTFIDDFLHLLTAEEWKILTYITRRTLGFHRRQDRISITQLAEGLVELDGTRRDWGVGLSRSAVIAALDGLTTYGFVFIVEGEARTSRMRTCYELQLDFDLVDQAGLEARAEARYQANLRRTRKASAARTESEKSSPSDEPQNGGSQSVPQTESAVRPTDREEKERSPSDEPNTVRETDSRAVRPVNRHDHGKEKQIGERQENQINNNTAVAVDDSSHDPPDEQADPDAGDLVAYLKRKGMNAAKEFADIPYAIGRRDFDARRADGQPIEHIVTYWRAQRPTAEEHYGHIPPDRQPPGRAHAADRRERSAPADRRDARHTARPASIRPGGQPPPYVPLSDEAKAALRNAAPLSVDLSFLRGRRASDGEG